MKLNLYFNEYKVFLKFNNDDFHVCSFDHASCMATFLVY